MKARDLIKFSVNPRLVENTALPVGFIRNAFYNGVGRHVCQLQRVTIKFCKSSATSHGVRRYIEDKLLDFSRKNPGIVVYIKPRLHKTPVIVSEYLNGQQHWMNIRNFSDQEIEWWLEFLRTRSGFDLTQLRSDQNVLIPSTQGIWNPFLNRPSKLNLMQLLPNEERSKFIPEVPSATQQLLNLAKKLNEETSTTSTNKSE